ncbi:helix-turn-helix domain-containing protein [Chryseobacterium sp. RP-3-3]|uniref:Helix-turn-helix domain-containing protein n=1 Tax=Chryseobacterium antibioticum TaxID=2728847 RepID=A0A7Y0AKN9_9FLAO|nr:helix-turn-helix domain-containing protein [Chryseobacterium antibioticum]NML69070.1 helix-turn-helix domain-containing protein [Chryseobacterium antibioticum]
MKPNYRKIYEDLLMAKYPEKLYLLENLQDLSSSISIINIDESLSIKDLQTNIENQRSKAYDKESIQKILTFQKKEQLNNSQVAMRFNLSRNTVAKWKKIFASEF